MNCALQSTLCSFAVCSHERWTKTLDLKYKGSWGYCRCPQCPNLILNPVGVSCWPRLCSAAHEESRHQHFPYDCFLVFWFQGEPGPPGQVGPAGPSGQQGSPGSQGITVQGPVVCDLFHCLFLVTCSSLFTVRACLRNGSELWFMYLHHPHQQLHSCTGRDDNHWVLCWWGPALHHSGQSLLLSRLSLMGFYWKQPSGVPSSSGYSMNIQAFLFPVIIIAWQGAVARAATCLGWQDPCAHAVAVNYPGALQGAGTTWAMDVEQQDALCLKGFCHTPTVCFCFNPRGHQELKERKETLESLACR